MCQYKAHFTPHKVGFKPHILILAFLLTVVVIDLVVRGAGGDRHFSEWATIQRRQ